MIYEIKMGFAYRNVIFKSFFDSLFALDVKIQLSWYHNPNIILILKQTQFNFTNIQIFWVNNHSQSRFWVSRSTNKVLQTFDTSFDIKMMVKSNAIALFFNHMHPIRNTSYVTGLANSVRKGQSDLEKNGNYF